MLRDLIGVSPTCTSSNRPTDLIMAVKAAETANLLQTLLAVVGGKVRVMTWINTHRQEKICKRRDSSMSLEKEANLQK